jgi:hypothetical protein
MNPVNNASAGEFSPCTLNTICGLFSSLGSCLQGKLSLYEKKEGIDYLFIYLF